MSVIDEVQTTGLYTNVTTSAVTTTMNPGEQLPVYVGFIACVVTVSLYSVMFLPVKKYETGDGMFFQWCVCVGVGCVGVVVKLFRYQADFYPLSMIGGVCWVTGNLCVVPIVKTIGLGLGCTIWGILSLLSGWATGRFGLFHTDKDVISNNTLNNISVILFIFSAIILSLVRNNIGAQKYGERELSVTQEPLLLKERKTSTNESQYIINKEESTMSPVLRQIVGVTLSIISGILYGQVFTAAKYYQDKGYSPNGLDYVFSTYCGIFILGTVYLLMYAMFMQNKPRVYPSVILPGCITGMMWAGATSSFFVANKVLSLSVSIPINTTLPGVIATIIGVVVFKEITGKKNLVIVGIGMISATSGAVCAGLSF